MSGANQPPPLLDYNAVAADTALCEGYAREARGRGDAGLRALGALAGSAESIGWGFDANRNAPELRAFDRFGERIDEVAFHPAYHRLMEVAVREGLHAAPWCDDGAGAHVERAAKFYVWSQVDAGHGCPISMTYAAVPALRLQPDVAALWVPALAARAYDPGLRPLAEKAGALCGMGMTERQGGSDVRSNTTRAIALGPGGAGGEYALHGHKWFCSAPMSDAFLVLAQSGDGLGCFLLPRVLPDGARNAFHIDRLKDKLGNRSNASSEVRFDGALAVAVSDPARGLATIIAMVNQTRLDCIIGSAAGMRQAVVQALHHCRHRFAFGKLLVDQPLMRAVLVDLALEAEAAVALMLRLARACDAAPRDPAEAHLQRLGTAVGKYWICKRAAMHAAEALECLGGNGYIEESIMPRLYREAPLNSIWEGSGNVNALDVLRACAAPGVLDAFVAEVGLSAGGDRRLDAYAARLREMVAGAREADARRVAESLALVLQASLLVRFAPPAVADAFCASRLNGAPGRTFGALPAGVATAPVLERALVLA